MSLDWLSLVQGRSLKSIECVKVVFQIKFDLLKCFFVSVIAIKPSIPNDLSWPGLSDLRRQKNAFLQMHRGKSSAPPEKKVSRSGVISEWKGFTCLV